MNCGVKFETIAPVGNAYNEETYLSSYIDTTSTLRSIKYNDHEWKYRMYLLDGHGITVYAKKYNNKLYLVTFENTHFRNCNEKFNQILPTLQFK